MRRAATVADVAATAGVAKATAARVLGGYGSTSERMRQRVLDAAQALGYLPNAVARTMNTGRSRSIGVVVGDIENGFFSLATRGISDTATAAGYDVILTNTAEGVEAEIAAVRVLSEKRVDGLIVAAASYFEGDHLAQVVSSGRPLVLLDREVESLAIRPVHASTDAAATAAASALLDAGHTRIAFLSAVLADAGWTGAPLRNSSVFGRIRAIDARLRESGIDWRPELVQLNARGYESVDRALGTLLASGEPPTAIITSDSLIASNALKSMRSRGLRIPADISFVTFDDFQWTELTDPPLSVIRQPIYELGVAAATQLIAEIDGLAAGECGELPEATLVVRGSIGPVRRS